MIKGNLSMYMKSLLRFSLVTVSMSTTSLLSVNTQRSPEFTLLRLSRQKGHDWDLVLLQKISDDIQLSTILDSAWTCTARYGAAAKVSYTEMQLGKDKWEHQKHTADIWCTESLNQMTIMEIWLQDRGKWLASNQEIEEFLMNKILTLRMVPVH